MVPPRDVTPVMSVEAAYVLPHPPVLLEQVGKAMSGQVLRTAEATRRVGEEISSLRPDAVIIMSPHSHMVPGYLGVMQADRVSGSFAKFGAPEVGGSFDIHQVLADAVADEIRRVAAEAGERVAGSDGVLPRRYDSETLDHGLLVPLAAMRPGLADSGRGFPPLVLLSVSWAEAGRHSFVGRAIRRAAATLGLSVVFIASGDLSHRLTPEAPAGYNPTGQLFDQAVQSIFTSGRLRELTTLDPDVTEAAGECGLRSLCTLAGLFEGTEPDKLESDVLSYEAPFGVGYMVARVREISESK